MQARHCWPTGPCVGTGSVDVKHCVVEKHCGSILNEGVKKRSSMCLTSVVRIFFSKRVIFTCVPPHRMFDAMCVFMLGFDLPIALITCTKLFCLHIETQTKIRNATTLDKQCANTSIHTYMYTWNKSCICIHICPYTQFHTYVYIHARSLDGSNLVRSSCLQDCHRRLKDDRRSFAKHGQRPRTIGDAVAKGADRYREHPGHPSR